ncbi:MAG: hypothetical protein C4567_01860 [Deltaproteobacteria bacterium]|nr:MAG: hypothetical protein C4567_01860 [Deltaproteobacteria bacterium]
MLEPTIITWILIIVGLTIYVFPLYIQILAVRNPHSQKVKDLLIGKGEDYVDRTHFLFCHGTGWADLIMQFPPLAIGSIGVVLGRAWGYLLWMAVASIAIYISIVLWFIDREYVYPKCGPLAFYTYYWGIWVYWSVAVIAYCLFRFNGVVF